MKRCFPLMPRRQSNFGSMTAAGWITRASAALDEGRAIDGRFAIVAGSRPPPCQRRRQLLRSLENVTTSEHVNKENLCNRDRQWKARISRKSGSFEESGISSPCAQVTDLPGRFACVLGSVAPRLEPSAASVQSDKAIANTPMISRGRSSRSRDLGKPALSASAASGTGIRGPRSSARHWDE